MLLAAASATLLITASAEAWAEGSTTPQFGVGFAAALASLEQAAELITAWVRKSYAKRPLVMIGLAGILLLPMLVGAGLLLYRRRPIPPATPGPVDADPAAGQTAWLEIADRRIAIPPSRAFVQIGRSRDNDVCLDDESVHRYHAVIERKRGRGFTITDIGGADGSGVSVNGTRMGSAVLADGDTIELGRARLKFATAA
jgi:hypothetical protein